MNYRIGTAVVIVGLIILAVGFIPLTRAVTVTEEKIKEVTEYREETKTREEPYTEEIETSETKEEVLLRESISVMKGSTAGKDFELTSGDVIIFKVHSDDDMIISFFGPGAFYLSMEVSKDIEREFTIKEDGSHSLLYSPLSVTEDIIIDFDIVRSYTATVTETVEKTKTVEYTEKVPYTVEVPYTEEVTKEEKYSLDPLKYLGVGMVIVGLVLLVGGLRKSE